MITVKYYSIFCVIITGKPAFLVHNSLKNCLVRRNFPGNFGAYIDSNFFHNYSFFLPNAEQIKSFRGSEKHRLQNGPSIQQRTASELPSQDVKVPAHDRTHGSGRISPSSHNGPQRTNGCLTARKQFCYDLSTMWSQTIITLQI